LEIEFVGDLAAMIEAALGGNQKTKKPPGKPDGFFELVAGARNHLCRTRIIIPRRRVPSV
jgi:hypothetical protein